MDLAPRDGGIDTNNVILHGAGLVESFGPGREGLELTVNVAFSPDGMILLRHNAPDLVLMTGQDRVIDTLSFGRYRCIGGYWHEISFDETGANNLERRVTAQRDRIEELERRIEELTRLVETPRW
jgi:hypothetical protein